MIDRPMPIDGTWPHSRFCDERWIPSTVPSCSSSCAPRCSGNAIRLCVRRRRLSRYVLYPRQALDSLRPSERGHCQQCDMLKFGSRETLGESSTSVRMDRTMRVSSNRKCEVDKSLGSSVKRPRLAKGSAKLLKGSPDIRVILRDVLRSRRQADFRILGEISRRCSFHHRLPNG